MKRRPVERPDLIYRRTEHGGAEYEELLRDGFVTVSINSDDIALMARERKAGE